MTRDGMILLATFGSAALLVAAFGFQHLGGLAPCQLCLWQRWPHAVAVGAGVLAYGLGARGFAWVGAMATAATGAIGVYHAGVEWGWWPGPSACSGGGADLTSMDGTALLSLDAPTGVVMCDEVVWQFVGLSMAGWNALIALGLTLLWIAAARRA